MENINISGSRNVFFIPTVNFDAETGKCELSGESFLEDTEEFYKPLLNWLEDRIALKKPIDFTFRLSYFNTSSSKSILDILIILKKFQDEGGKVEIRWYYDGEDIDLEETLEDFIITTGVDIELHTY